METRKCTECSNIIGNGLITAFGDSFFHLKCFVCAKCSKPVNCESNLLLLKNGKPVCETCCYSCTVCRKYISDEAIMTGDKAYHASCFKCVSCQLTIQDLIFTRTSKGIHCSSCHEKRKAYKKKRKQQRETRQNFKEITDLINNSFAETIVQNPTPRPAQIDTTRIMNKPSLYDTYSGASTDLPTPSLTRDNSAKESSRVYVDTAPPTPSLNSELFSASTDSPSPPSSITSPLSISGGSLDKFQTVGNFSSPVLCLEDALHSSFFDKECTDIVNLAKTLGAKIIQDKEKSITNNGNDLNAHSPQPPHLTNADSVPQPPEFSISNSENELLRAELDAINSKMVIMQKRHEKVREATLQALYELNKAKEGIEKEAQLRQQQDLVIARLKQKLQQAYHEKLILQSEQEATVDKEIKPDSNKSSNEFKTCRAVLVKDIKSLAQTSHDTEYETYIQKQPRVSPRNTSCLKGSTENMSKGKTSLEILRNRKSLQKNTEYIDHKPTEHVLSPVSPISSDLLSPVQPTKLFNFKGNMFSRFSNKKDPVEGRPILHKDKSEKSLNIIISSSNVDAFYNHGLKAENQYTRYYL